MMGYRTPNIDRIAREGMRFTDYYGEQSCTAGRAAFIMGQSVFRTGLSKVGLPGAEEGMQEKTRPSPACSRTRATPPASSARTTSATATSTCRPTTASTSSSATSTTSTPRKSRRTRTTRRHGPARRQDLPRAVRPARRDPLLRRPTAQSASRTPARSPRSAWRPSTTRPPSRHRVHPRAARGRQALVLLVERHPHALPHARQGRAHCAASPVRTSTPTAWSSTTCTSASFLDLLDELGIADNTIVMYSTDNGPHMNTWPDAGMTPFRNEKNTNWEGAWRVPAFVRWPGKIPAGRVTNEIVHHMDWLPTFAAAPARTTSRKTCSTATAPEAIGAPTRSTSTATTSSRC
jgi:hypothetical protein